MSRYTSIPIGTRRGDIPPGYVFDEVEVLRLAGGDTTIPVRRRFHIRTRDPLSVRRNGKAAIAPSERVTPETVAAIRLLATTRGYSDRDIEETLGYRLSDGTIAKIRKRNGIPSGSTTAKGRERADMRRRESQRRHHAETEAWSWDARCGA